MGFKPGGVLSIENVYYMIDRGVTRALIGGGVYIHIQEIRRAEHEYMNIHPPPPPINALVTPLMIENVNGIT